MKKFSAIVAFAALVAMPLAAQAEDAAPAASAAAVKGKMLYATGNQRVGAIYKVTTDGSAQVILNGKLVTIPGSTITAANGKIETSLSKNELNSIR